MKAQTVIILFVGLTIISVGGYLVIKSDSGPAEPTKPVVASETELARPTAYSKGASAAPVRIVEFSDFQCPACAAEYPILKKVAEEYKDKVAFTYRHFPLSQHQNAKPAAYAAEAAGRQGKFWEMHDKLFENQNSLSEENIKKFAQALDLDMNRFETDRKSAEVAAVVGSDVDTGTRLKVNATPTIFINGTHFQGGLSYDQFKKEIESRLK